MRAWPLLLLPLCGCPGGYDPYDYVSGEAFLYNADDEPLEVELLQVHGALDCAVVEHPRAAAALPSSEGGELITLEPAQVVDAWRDTIDQRQEWVPCLVGRMRVDEQVATMVFDLNLGWQEIVVPTAPADLSHNTVLLETGPDGPAFRAGPQQDKLTVGPSDWPACETTTPTWTAVSATDATVLALEEADGCTTLALLGDRTLRVCDAPALPYSVGEDLDIDAGPTHLAIRTSSGGKPYLLGSGPGALPSWLHLDVFRDDATHLREVRLPACDVPSTCSPTLPVDPIVSDGGAYVFAPWGEPVDVVDPDGSARRLTVHSAGAPLDRDCPIVVHFSLIPAVGSF